MTKWLLMVVLNGLFGAIGYLLYREGIVSLALQNDVVLDDVWLPVIPAIIAVAVYGFVSLRWSIQTAEWCSESCVALGLLGTVFGGIQAFSSIDPSMVGDLNRAGELFGTLIPAIGAALWTTATGVCMNLWLSANIRLEEGYASTRN